MSQKLQVAKKMKKCESHEAWIGGKSVVVFCPVKLHACLAYISWKFVNLSPWSFQG